MPDDAKRRRWRRWVRDLLLLALVFLSVQWWQTRNLTGYLAPPLRGLLSDGRSTDLRDYAGQPVLVYFWADWCPVCRAGEDTIDRLGRTYPVLTVATQSGDAARINGYLRERQLGFPVLLDESGELGGSWGIQGVPTSFVVARDGRIASASVGYTTAIGLRLRLWLAGI